MLYPAVICIYFVGAVITAALLCMRPDLFPDANDMKVCEAVAYAGMWPFLVIPVLICYIRQKRKEYFVRPNVNIYYIFIGMPTVASDVGSKTDIPVIYSRTLYEEEET